MEVDGVAVVVGLPVEVEELEVEEVEVEEVEEEVVVVDVDVVKSHILSIFLELSF